MPTQKKISLEKKQAELNGFGHSCPDCGCCDFRKPAGPKNIPGGQRRYAVCRNCGLSVPMIEKIDPNWLKKKS